MTVGFVLVFAPGMFEPFTTDAGPQMIVGDRSAVMLAEDILVESPTRPGVLDTSCTAAFFGTGAIPSDCRFDTRDLQDVTGSESGHGLNVTIRRAGSIRSIGSTTLAAGPAPPPTASVVTSQRLVYVDGAEGRLVVRVW
mgnify:CR=1 FL=1